MHRSSLRIEYSGPNFQTALFHAVAEIPLEQVYEEIKTIMLSKETSHYPVIGSQRQDKSSSILINHTLAGEP